MENAFALPTEQVLAQLGVDGALGLTDAQVLEQRAKHGSNCEYRQTRSNLFDNTC